MGERPVVQRREPVSLEEWTKNIDSEGRILNVDNMKQMIFRGVITLVFLNCWCSSFHFLLGGGRDELLFDECCLKIRVGQSEVFVMSLRVGLEGYTIKPMERYSFLLEVLWVM